ncbi:PGF-pre-PGF domain-containing protein [Candidatus Woesearchaeota archaeon]|nr:PGF-pre-PGF domain-containing protein [Candidatus Woesearchaeota archaeon]
MKLSKLIFLAVFILALINIASATSVQCWTYDDNQTGCEENSDLCTWMSDQWGSWCNQKGCWNFWNQTGCNNASASGMSCQWKAMPSSGWCEEKECWNFWNQTLCEQYNTSMGCQWDSSNNNCYKKGCWEYNSYSNCINADDFKGDDCQWNSNGNYCYEEGCWNYNTKTDCEDSTLDCMWDTSGQFCEEVNCWNWDYNSTGCLDNEFNLSCEYHDPWCDMKGCWDYQSQDQCNNKTECNWKISDDPNAGWCEQAGCWNWDYQGANLCMNASANVSLNCIWNDPWCYENFTAGCSMHDGKEKDCMDTGYCFYDIGDNLCKDPMDHNIAGFDPDQDFMNPDCWILDRNETRCNQTFGCTYNSTLAGCMENSTANPNIVDGIKCSFINDSDFCNKVPFLGGCCAWNGTDCTKAPMSTMCWDNMEDPGEGMYFCEDYNVISSQSNCNKIAGSPWFMPCEWENSSSKCRFRMNDKDIEDIKQITNKKECEQAGGEWIQEYYCDSSGNKTLPFGWCEMKTGSGAKSCSQVCWACEFQDSSGKTVTSTNARSACDDSPLGFCEFVPDTHAPNGLGICKPKDEFKKTGGDCNSDCGACTFIGDPLAGEPQTACLQSNANCKWFKDPEDSTKGWCDSATVSSCAEECNKCYSETACSDVGGTGNLDSSGEPKYLCGWSDGYCKRQNENEGDSEICFDGIDNDQDGFFDCGDSECMTDSFCGGDMMGNCMMYYENESCIANDCAWIESSEWGYCDPTNYSTHNISYCAVYDNSETACELNVNCTWYKDAWCDVKGAECWMEGQTQAECEAPELADNCQWNIPPSGGACDTNQTHAELCFSIFNSTECNNTAGCTWLEGMCDGATMEYQMHCEMSYDGDESGCLGDSNCIWWSGGECEAEVFSCFDNMDNESCSEYSSCQWRFDPWMQREECQPICFGDVDKGTCDTMAPICEWREGFCDPKFAKMTDCWEYDNNMEQCNNQTTCQWIIEYQPFCDVNMSTMCFELNSTDCIASSECTYWNDSFSGESWCDFKAFECEMNWTRHSGAAACTDNNNYCAWDPVNSRCFPSCFNSSISSSGVCNANPGCEWRSGRCEGKMTAQMYGGFIDNPPIVLDIEPDSDSGVPNYLDINAFYIKDDKDVYALGVGVMNIENASICNGEMVADQSNGGMLKLAKGTASTKFYWYIDSDGDNSNNCKGLSDSGQNISGFEFKFSYVGSWDGGIEETRTAYRCDGGQWMAAEIKLSTFRKMMCEDISGSMVAVDKEDLNSFSSLIDTSADLRIMVTSTNSSGDADNILDSLGPTYYSPDQFDFKFEDCFCPECDMDKDGMKASDDPDCEQFQKFGFVPVQDCFNQEIDNDGDGAYGCDDTDCFGDWYCNENNLGVESSIYVDTTAPTLLGKKVVRYPDGVFIAYDSNEPANGTLFFYGTDPGCSNQTNNKSDTHITKRHGLIARNVTKGINYNFENGTTYYYKLQLKDRSNNTAISSCFNFTTASTDSKKDCPDCRIIVRFDSLPSGWNAEMYHDDQWFTQGNLPCGAAAGILVLYNESLHLRFLDNTTKAGIAFINVTPRTLSGNAKTIEDDHFQKGSVNKQGGGTADYVVADKDKIEDLIDKLRPEECRVYISGNTSQLYHCGDVTVASTCKDRTSEATRIGYNATTDTTEWIIPNCEFSAYLDGLPATASQDNDDDGSPGGSSGSATSGSAPGGGSSTTGTSATRLWSSMSLGLNEMEITKTDIAFKKLSIYLIKELNDTKIKVTALSEKPETITKPEGYEIYQYLEITPTRISDEDISRVELLFSVNKSWIEGKPIDEESVRLFKFGNGNWIELMTSKPSSGDDSVSYKSISSGFSYFAITGKIKEIEEIIEEEVQPEEEQPPADTGNTIADLPSSDEKPGINPMLYVAVFALLIGIVGIFNGLFMHKKKKEKVKHENKHHEDHSKSEK